MSNFPEYDQGYLHRGGLCGCDTSDNKGVLEWTGGGYVVDMLEFWYERTQGFVLGLRLTFSNGVQSTMGSTGGNPTHTLSDLTNKLIKSGSIGSTKYYGSYCLGYFKLTTDEGESFEVGKLSTTGDSHSFSGASGVLVGFSGRAGSVIDALEPLFLKKITNFYDKFTLRAEGSKGNITTDFAQTNVYDIVTDMEVEFKYTESLEKTVSLQNSNEKAVEKAHSVSVEVSVEAEFDVALASTTVSTTASYGYSQTDALKTSVTSGTESKSLASREETITIPFGHNGAPRKIYEVSVLKYTTLGAATVERTCSFNGTKEVFTWTFPATINAVGRFNVVIRDMTETYLGETSTVSANEIRTASVKPMAVTQQPLWEPAAIYGAVKKGTTPIGKPFSMGSLSQAIPTN